MLGSDTLVPSLALESLRLHLGVDKVVVRHEKTGVQSLVLKDVVIPTDRHGRLVSTIARHGEVRRRASLSFPSYRAVDV